MNKSNVTLDTSTEHGEKKNSNVLSVLLTTGVIIILVLFVGGCIWSAMNEQSKQEQEEERANQATHYDVTGTVTNIQKTLRYDLALGGAAQYEVQINGQYVPIGSRLPEDIKVGKEVHLIGDRNGLDELKVLLP